MSATVDAQRFSSYLAGAPILNVPGRTFPVQTKYLEDAVELTGYRGDEQGGGTQARIDDDDDEFDLEEQSTESKTKIEAMKALSSYSKRTRSTLLNFDEYHINYELIISLLLRIATEDDYTKFSKAILVFLPGIAEIRRLNDMILGHPAFSKQWYVYPLHSTIASEDQEQAFYPPPEGIRKIVLATNIAETGWC